MLRAITICTVLCLGLAGCIPGQEATPRLEPVGEARIALDRAACEKRGGEFRKAGGGGVWVCLNRLSDAGKSCRTGSDCEGACLARSMSCAPLKPLIGCNEVITSSGLRVTECVE
jgi:hypothetical protein